MKRNTLRIARKSAHLSSKVLHRAINLTRKVEDKATRILDGTDFSVKADSSIPLEKIYYNTLPYITPINPSLPAIGSSGSVVLFLPTLDGKSFYGGTATALVVAGRIAHLKGLRLKIVQTLKTGKPNDLSGFFKREGLEFSDEAISIVSVADRKYNFYGYVSMHPDDIYIASAWWDAHLVSQLPLKKRFIYLIQDFEPIFYNNSDMYVLAEATYTKDNFIPLCNTQLMHDFMKSRHYPAFESHKSFWFEPAVSRLASGHVLKKMAGEKRRLFLYGRPDVHRNLFFTALESIDYSFKSNLLNASEWELYMAGQDNIPDIKLSSGIMVKNLGKMTMEEYTHFSKTIDIAVSPMMAPHPNYPTLEFASIGTCVVTTKYENKQDLTRYSHNIFTSDITSKAMADNIFKASQVSYKSRVDNAKKSTIETQWQHSLDEKLKIVLDKI